jgi:uncharacterized protein (DUF433 family)
MNSVPGEKISLPRTRRELPSATVESLSKSTPESVELRQNDEISLSNSLRQGNSRSRSRRGSSDEIRRVRTPRLPPKRGAERPARAAASNDIERRIGVGNHWRRGQSEYILAPLERHCPMNQSSVVRSDPHILGGTPVFVGTRVPVQALIDYIEGGHSLGEFLDDFPTVPREIVIAALEQAKAHLIADARAA